MVPKLFNPSSMDMGDKFLLIGLTVQLYNFFKSKKPEVTVYQTIKTCLGPADDHKFAEELADICEEFMYNCNKFPDFGIPLKEIPGKIKELYLSSLPF